MSNSSPISTHSSISSPHIPLTLKITTQQSNLTSIPSQPKRTQVLAAARDFIALLANATGATMFSVGCAFFIFSSSKILAMVGNALFIVGSFCFVLGSSLAVAAKLPVLWHSRTSFSALIKCLFDTLNAIEFVVGSLLFVIGSIVFTAAPDSSLSSWCWLIGSVLFFLGQTGTIYLSQSQSNVKQTKMGFIEMSSLTASMLYFAGAVLFCAGGISFFWPTVPIGDILWLIGSIAFLLGYIIDGVVLVASIVRARHAIHQFDSFKISSGLTTPTGPDSTVVDSPLTQLSAKDIDESQFSHRSVPQEAKEALVKSPA